MLNVINIKRHILKKISSVREFRDSPASTDHVRATSVT